MDTVPRAPRTHDYTRRYWGHDYSFTPLEGGQRATIIGWGLGLQAGDYLLLEDRDVPHGSTRYQIEHIEYYGNPADMWELTARFAPRPAQQEP